MTTVEALDYAVRTLRGIANHYNGSLIEPSLLARHALSILAPELEPDYHCPHCGSQNTELLHAQARHCIDCSCDWLGPGLI